MISYKQNPNLNKKTVTTVAGETEYRVNCVKINNDYYVKNKDCVRVNNRWYRKNSPRIFFNYSLNTWQHITEKQRNLNIVEGYVAPNQRGHFIYNPYKTDRHVDGSLIMDVTKPGIYEVVSEGGYTFCEPQNTSYVYQENFQNYPYNLKDYRNEYHEVLLLYNNAPLPLYTNTDYEIAQILGSLTFGCEFEVISGYLPKHIRNTYGVVVCRDGSVGNNGGEFVTIPYAGARGVRALKELCKELMKRCCVDHTCSFHIHFGNFKYSKKFIIAHYTLMRALEDDFFKLFPEYKRVGLPKRKKYNMPLRALEGDTVEEKFFNLHKYYADDPDFTEEKYPLFAAHPRTRKWDIPGRYHWVNYLNAFFGAQNTIEFRLHHGTVNVYKVIYWLILCSATLRYTEMYMDDILKGNLPDSLNELLDKIVTNPNLRQALSTYMIKRILYFMAMSTKSDIFVKNEFKNDKDFCFNDYPLDI